MASATGNAPESWEAWADDDDDNDAGTNHQNTGLGAAVSGGDPHRTASLIEDSASPASAAAMPLAGPIGLQPPRSPATAANTAPPDSASGPRGGVEATGDAEAATASDAQKQGATDAAPRPVRVVKAGNVAAVSRAELRATKQAAKIQRALDRAANRAAAQAGLREAARARLPVGKAILSAASTTQSAAGTTAAPGTPISGFSEPGSASASTEPMLTRGEPPIAEVAVAVDVEVSSLLDENDALANALEPPPAVWMLVLERVDIDTLETCRWVSRTVRAYADADYLWRRQLLRLLPSVTTETLTTWRDAFGQSWRALCRHFWAALQARLLGRLPTLREIAQSVVPPDATEPNTVDGSQRRRVMTGTVVAFRQGGIYGDSYSISTYYGLQICLSSVHRRASRLIMDHLPVAVRLAPLHSSPRAWRGSVTWAPDPAPAAASATAASAPKLYRPWIVVAAHAESILFIRNVVGQHTDTPDVYAVAPMPRRFLLPTSLVLLSPPPAEDIHGSRVNGRVVQAAPAVVAALATSYFVHLYDAVLGEPLVWPERGMTGSVLETSHPIAALAGDSHRLVASLSDGSLCVWALQWKIAERDALVALETDRPVSPKLAAILDPPVCYHPAQPRSFLPPVVVQVSPPLVRVPSSTQTSSNVGIWVRVAYQNGELEWWALGFDGTARRVDEVPAAPGTHHPTVRPSSPFGAGWRGLVWEFVDQSPALGGEVLLSQMFGMSESACLHQRGDVPLSHLLQVDPTRKLVAHRHSPLHDPLVEQARYEVAARGNRHAFRRVRGLDELMFEARDLPERLVTAFGGIWSLPSPIFRPPSAPRPTLPVLERRSSILVQALEAWDSALAASGGSIVEASAVPIAWRQLELRCWEALRNMRRLQSGHATDNWLPLTSVPWVRDWSLADLLNTAYAFVEQENCLADAAVPSAAAQPKNRKGRKAQRASKSNPGGRGADESVAPRRRELSALVAGGVDARVDATTMAVLSPMRRARNFLCVRVRAPKWDLPHLYVAWQEYTAQMVAAEAELENSRSDDVQSSDDDAVSNEGHVR